MTPRLAFRPMRIGHYMRKMFEPGGIASYIRLVAKGLREKGHDLFFFDRDTPGEARIPSPEEMIFTADDDDLIRRAADLRLDVLHVHMAVDADALAGASVRIIRTVHTHSPYCPSQGRFLKRSGSPCNRNYSLCGCLWGHFVDRCGSIRPRALLRNFQTVRQEIRGLGHITSIAVSQFIKDQMVRAGHPADKIHVLYLPAPAPRPYLDPPRDGPPTFAFLGRLIPHKGVDWLLRSLRHVHADIRMELAGTGNQEQEYRTLAHNLRLENRAIFRGWLAPDQVQDLLARARALVYPSVWHEPGALATYEAMASGRAMILSNVGGLPEIAQNGTTALLIPPGDEHALAQAIDRLADNYDLAKSLGQAGLELVTHHRTLAGHLNALLNLYQTRP